MDKYIVLDIESPNTYFSSVSAIGIIVVENNKITDKIYSLINPEEEFEDYIIELTGITPEMVEDKPTFKEFWPEIEELLIMNTIVGHNISYDLTVISNSLRKYHIDVPSFKYVCTLNLSRQLLTLNSYALTDIMKELNVDYDAHNALADAEVTHYLFNYLKNIKPIAPINVKNYSKYVNYNNIIEELYPNINELYGITMEFKYKDEITENQIQVFRDWIEKNREYSNIKKINIIIKKLSIILDKKTLEKEDKINISTLVTSITKSDKYSKEELNYQVLTGILKMLKCDDIINDKEIDFLNKWLFYYSLPENVNINIESLK